MAQPEPIAQMALGHELRMDARMLACVFDHTAYPLLVKDRERRFVLLNRAACDLLGLPREDQLGKTDYDLFPRAVADCYRSSDDAAFATGEVQVIESEPFTDAEGRSHLISTTKVPVRDERGEVELLVVMLHDISALKETEEQLRRRNQELLGRVHAGDEALAAAHEELRLKDRLAAMGEIAGGIAHQIRNPLAVMVNSAQLLERLARAHGDQAMDVQARILREEAFKISAVVSGLLDFARSRPVRRTAVAPSALLTRTLGSMELPANVELVTELPPLPEVLVDPEQVRQALGNLVQNALEAMPGGGRLSVAGRLEGRDVVLSVSDTGAGISPEDQRRLFRPLMTTKPAGLGLGLVTARVLVENQGGAIRFESEPGRGTRFEVVLPARGEVA